MKAGLVPTWLQNFEREAGYMPYSMTYRVLTEKLIQASCEYYSPDGVFQIGKFTNVAFPLIREAIKGIENPYSKEDREGLQRLAWEQARQTVLEALGGTDG